MRIAVIRWWLFVIASGGCLLGTGCPNTDQLKNVLADSIGDFANDVVGLVISGFFTST
ncbi:MAG: hypothetical protein JSV03_06490 [Planctomycetota bacterium]|nr:MAG: hypothetical protein JSV03_06490 [Planctomycetota bacterium]